MVSGVVANLELGERSEVLFPFLPLHSSQIPFPSPPLPSFLLPSLYLPSLPLEVGHLKPN